MVNLDTRFITKEINYFGNTITIRKVIVDTSASKWGDATETYEDIPNIKCVVYTISESDTEYRESGFKAGDLIFFFDVTNEQYMENGNRILYESHWYQIINIKRWRVADGAYSFEAYTNKI